MKNVSENEFQKIDDSGNYRKHKEEGQQRKKLDQEDRQKIADAIKEYENPLLSIQDEALHNIVNGRTADWLMFTKLLSLEKNKPANSNQSYLKDFTNPWRNLL